jgi:hypothetical protein
MTRTALPLPPAPVAGNVARAIAAMHRVLSSVGWDGLEDPEGATVAVDFGAPHRPVADAVMAIERQAETFIATFNFGRAGAATLDEVARFATRANWELVVGNFELNLETGAVRFRSSIPFAGGELQEAAIRSAIGTAMGVVDAYAEALAEVIEGGMRADEALDRVWTADPGEACGHG